MLLIALTGVAIAATCVVLYVWFWAPTPWIPREEKNDEFLDRQW